MHRLFSCIVKHPSPPRINESNFLIKSSAFEKCFQENNFSFLCSHSIRTSSNLIHSNFNRTRRMNRWKTCCTDLTISFEFLQIANDSLVYRTRYFAIPQDDDSQVSKSTIDFKVTNDMFRNGRLMLQCTAFIADVYRESAEIEISEDAPRIASITGESPPRGHREWNDIQTFFYFFIPVRSIRWKKIFRWII